MSGLDRPVGPTEVVKISDGGGRRRCSNECFVGRSRRRRPEVDLTDVGHDDLAVGVSVAHQVRDVGMGHRPQGHELR